MQEETLIINNVTIISGDGSRPIENGRITISDGVIQDVGATNKPLRGGKLIRVIDGTGKIAIPGIINMHAHGVTFGPGFMAEPPWPVNYVVRQLLNHLLYGTTTVLSVDGYLLPSEVQAGMEHVPIKIRTTTLHTPMNIKMAKECYREYALSKEQESFTVEKAIEGGAIAIGQVGGGLALLNMWYHQIPGAIEKRTRRVIAPREARRLFENIVGRYIKTDVYDEGRVENVLKELDLQEKMSPSEVRELVHNIVFPLYEVSLDVIQECAEIAKRLDVPVMVSNNSATKEVIRDISKQVGGLLIALHSNHPSFEVDEAVEQAKYLKSNGSFVEISTGDFLSVRRSFPSPDITRALLHEGIVDILSTDYAGGYFESILRVTEWALEEQLMPLERMIMLSTIRPKQALPTLAPNCGEIAPGRVADLVLINEKRISEVIVVIRDGELAVGPLGGKSAEQMEWSLN